MLGSFPGVYARKKAVSLSHCLVHAIISFMFQILCDTFNTSHNVIPLTCGSIPPDFLSVKDYSFRPVPL